MEKSVALVLMMRLRSRLHRVLHLLRFKVAVTTMSQMSQSAGIRQSAAMTEATVRSCSRKILLFAAADAQFAAQMLQMRSQSAGMSQSAVMIKSTVRSWSRRKPNQNPRQDVGHVAFPLAQVENNSTLKHWTAKTTMKRRLIEICCYFPYNLHE